MLLSIIDLYGNIQDNLYDPINVFQAQYSFDELDIDSFEKLKTK